MTDKEKIKAEVKRLMDEHLNFYVSSCETGDGDESSSPMVYTTLQMLLSFIDSL